jgi:AbrB family looped-hinge helix DNA binding protein
MALVKVKEKYQVTLPARMRQQAGLSVGDLLEAKVEGNKITLTPQTVLARKIELSLREFREGKGRTFKTADEAIRHLHQKARAAAKEPTATRRAVSGRVAIKEGVKRKPR